jgi:hypothetical protein
MRQANTPAHLAAAAIITILAALIYASVQQAHRSAANDPQLQIAGDIGNELRKSGTPGRWMNGDIIEISQSLSVFTILFDGRKEPVKSTGLLNGRLPHLPEGVFAFARDEGENVFTWQPQAGVRAAVVLRPVQSSSYAFVAVGRSLTEIEKREHNLLQMAFISWLLCMGVLLIHWLISFYWARRETG